MWKYDFSNICNYFFLTWKRPRLWRRAAVNKVLSNARDNEDGKEGVRLRRWIRFKPRRPQCDANYIQICNWKRELIRQGGRALRQTRPVKENRREESQTKLQAGGILEELVSKTRRRRISKAGRYQPLKFIIWCLRKWNYSDNQGHELLTFSKAQRY